MTKEKLITEYNNKVSTLDKSIKVILSMINQSRHDYTIDKNDLLEEKSIAYSTRQLYIQVLSDLEDLNL